MNSQLRIDDLRMGMSTEFSPLMVQRPCTGEEKEHGTLTGILGDMKSWVGCAATKGKMNTLTGLTMFHTFHCFIT